MAYTGAALLPMMQGPSGWIGPGVTDWIGTGSSLVVSGAGLAANAADDVTRSTARRATPRERGRIVTSMKGLSKWGASGSGRGVESTARRMILRKCLLRQSEIIVPCG